MKPRNFPGRKERRYVRANPPLDKPKCLTDYWPKDIRIRMGAAAHAELLRTQGGWS